jgi:hypothetical protein
MFFGSTGSNFAGARAGAVGSSASRSQILGRKYQPFSNPFFDHASTYTPPTVKSLFGFCRFYYLTHGLINSITTKAAEYPVTDVVLQHEATGVVRKWEELLLGVLNYRVHQLETNLDYFCYGNAFISPSFPFRKKIICDSCSAELDAAESRPHWRYTNHRWWLTCPKCGQSGFAKSRDDYYPKYSEIGLIRWNPENVHIFYNETTGRLDYGLDLSQTFRSQVLMGRKDLVATTPEIFLEAVKSKRSLVFDRKEVFHMRRPSLSSTNRGWGVPLIMPVLKDAFYMQVMKKAQECVHPDTLIDTAKGLTPAAQVEVGDLVRTHTGAFRPVVARSARPLRSGERAFEITVTGLRELSAVFSETHPIWVIRRNDQNRRVGTKEKQRSSVILRRPELYDYALVPAADIQVGDYVSFPTQRIQEQHVLDLARYGAWSSVTDEYVYTQAEQGTADSFESGGEGGSATNRKVARRLLAQGRTLRRVPRYVELDDDLAYIAGWYIGDGAAETRRVVFCLGPDDDGVELQSAIQRVFPFTTFSSYPSTTSRGWTLAVYGSAFARFMSAWLPGDARTKRVPAEIRDSEDGVVAAFLRGYQEADGHDRGVQLAVGSASLQLAYDVWTLGISLGCIGTISQRECYDSVITNALGEQQSLPGGGRIHNYVMWSTRSAARLRALMSGESPPEVVSGKSGFFFKGRFAARVVGAEDAEATEVLDFEVDEDHSFCVPGFAVHNSVLLTHLIPQVFLFPQPATGGADPFVTTDLQNWREHIRRELARQRADPSYYGILPFPLGHQTIGENGRSLLLMPEIQQLGEQIAVGMGFPIDLVYGHGTYAGSSVSMRMLENFFLANVHGQMRLLKWAMHRLAAFLNWPVAGARFKPFRMADDLQRQAYMFQMNQAGKVSDTTLLSYADLKVRDEAALMVAESAIRQDAVRKQSLLQAEIAGEAMVVQAKFQARAQQAQAEALNREQTQQNNPFATTQQSGLQGAGGFTLDAAAAALAEKLKVMPAEQQQVYLTQLQAQSPEMAQLVQEQMPPPGMPPPAPSAAPSSGVDMRPMPEQLPPRRAGGA